MFFDWSKVKESDLWQYKKRVEYLQSKLEKWNKEYAETGKVKVSEKEYFAVASELYYYYNESPYLSKMDKTKLVENMFFRKQ